MCSCRVCRSCRVVAASFKALCGLIRHIMFVIEAKATLETNIEHLVTPCVGAQSRCLLDSCGSQNLWSTVCHVNKPPQPPQFAACNGTWLRSLFNVISAHDPPYAFSVKDILVLCVLASASFQTCSPGAGARGRQGDGECTANGLSFGANR